MPAELKTQPDGSFQLVEEGKATVTLKPEEVVAKLQAADLPLDSRQVTLKVNGVSRTMTVAEAMAAASKVEGADERFRTAADAIKLQEAMHKIQQDPQSVTDADFEVVLNAAGASPEVKAQTLQALAAMRAQAQAGEQIVDGQGNPLEVPLAALPPEVQRLVGVADKIEKTQADADAANIRATIYDGIKKTLTKSPVLGIMIRNEAGDRTPAWEQDGSVASTLFAEMLDKVRARHTERPSEPITPEVIDGIAQTVVNRFKALGKVMANEQASPTALGPALGIASQVESVEPATRVPVFDPAHKTNFAQRMKAAYQRALRGPGA